MTNNRRKILAMAFCLFCFLSFGAIAQAANLGNAFKVSDEKNEDPLDKAAIVGGYKTTAENTSILPIFSKVVGIGLSFLGVIFLLLIVYGGFLWMSDQGNEEQVAKAKKLITSAAIGLVIVLSSYAVSWFILNVIIKQTQGGVE